MRISLLRNANFEMLAKRRHLPLTEVINFANYPTVGGLPEWHLLSAVCAYLFA